jgi:sugar/nucleoside kinase (ribokinase family)
MAGILLAGSVGADRIWVLDRKLRPGARLQCRERVLRLGGGAANTGAVLAELGHRPVIASVVGSDATADAMLAALVAAALEVGAIERRDGPTQAGEILLDPDGERTLIGGAHRRRALPEAVFSRDWSMLYVNIAYLLEPERLAGFRDRPWVIAQLPLDLDEPRPAHALIASRSDIADLPAELLWRRRKEIDGDGLRWIVVTDGGRGVELVDAQGVRHFPTQADAVADTIGAGDFFAAGLIDALVGNVPVENAIRQGQEVAARFLRHRPAMLRVLEHV